MAARRNQKKSKIVVRRLKDDDAFRDYRYWMSRPPDERIEAIEILRLYWHKIRNERPKRLRRVLRVMTPGKD